MTSSEVSEVCVEPKRCNRCGLMKSIVDFYLVRSGYSARQSRCKSCDRERSGSRRERASGVRVAREVRTEIDPEEVGETEENCAPDTERTYRQMVWRAYERAGGRAVREDNLGHVVEELELNRWVNEVYAELRAGRMLEGALTAANDELPADFGAEEPPAGFAPAAPKPHLELVKICERSTETCAPPPTRAVSDSRPAEARKSRAPSPQPDASVGLALVHSLEERALAGLAKLGRVPAGWVAYEIDEPLDQVDAALRSAEKRGRCRRTKAGRSLRWEICR